MPSFKKALLALSFTAAIAPAYGAWGDISYDTSPSRVDEDTVATFDSFGFISAAIPLSRGLTAATQNFETGFSFGQTVNDWVSIGGNKVRFGFGNTLSSIQWKGLIGAVDPSATEFGMTHPHGTYGNTEGILDKPRNYVADLAYITSAAVGGAQYFVMQFERPITFLSFSMLDYGTVGDKYSLSIWNGGDLDRLTKVDQGSQEAFNANRSVLEWRPDAGFDYFITPDGKGTGKTQFNTAIVYLDKLDPTVAFDNITIGMSSVPEPATLSLAGLGLIGMMSSLRKRKVLRA